MSLPQFQNGDQAFQLFQNSWAKNLNPVIKNNDAIGTLISNVNSVGITLVSGVIANLTSIYVQPGIWLIWGSVGFPNLPANATRTGAGISTDPLKATGTLYDGSASYMTEVPNNGSVSFSCGPVPLKLKVATQYFLNVVSTFSGTAPTAQGTIYAIQMGII